MNRKAALTYTVILLLGLAALALFSANAHSQTIDPRQDTSYVLGTDRGNATGIYPHYFQLTRRDSLLGTVLQGNANAGSCANVWCALVPTAPNVISQSGGTFTSLSAAAHEVVWRWNLAHPLPPDTTSSPTTEQYTQARMTCPATGYTTCYNIRVGGVLIGWVRQQAITATRRWQLGRGDTTYAGLETTLKAAALRLVAMPLPSTSDTIHKTVFVYDTVRTTVTMPPDTVWNHVIKYDTVHVIVYDSTKVVGLHIDDKIRGGHTGEMNVFKDTTYLGRIMFSGDGVNKQWFAYPKVPGKTLMTANPTVFPDSVSAMQSLLVPQAAKKVQKVHPR